MGIPGSFLPLRGRTVRAGEWWGLDLDEVISVDVLAVMVLCRGLEVSCELG
jgi:hypothetical protein